MAEGAALSQNHRYKVMPGFGMFLSQRGKVPRPREHGHFYLPLADLPANSIPLWADPAACRRCRDLRPRLFLKVDFIIARDGRLTPIEVKWTETPSLTDARHLLTFLGEHPKHAKHSYIICRCQQPLRLHDKVKALPWFCL